MINNSEYADDFPTEDENYIEKSKVKNKKGFKPVVVSQFAF